MTFDYKRPSAIFLTLTIAFSTGIATAQEDHVQLGFGSTINDSEIVELLNRHSASPTAVFTWASGLTGTHRTSTRQDTDEFLKKVRVDAISFLEDAVAANDVRLEKFLSSYSEDQLSEGEALQTQARSLLNIRSQIESALSTARSTRPMIFAIEVKGKASKLEELRTDPVVRVFNNAGDTTKDPATQSALKPIAYQAEFRDPVVQTASPGDLYELILDKVSENAEGVQ